MKTFKKIILDELKSLNRSDIAAKIKSIRYSSFAGGDSVSISTIDLNREQRDFLDTIARKYRCGSDYSNVIDGVRQANYLHIDIDFSEEKLEEAKSILSKKHKIFNDRSAYEVAGESFACVIYRFCKYGTIWSI